MKTRLLAFPLLVLGVIVFSGACTVTAGPSSCAPDGVACGSDLDCCGGVCDVDGFCGAAAACVADQDPCTTDSDCCGGEFCDETAQLTCQVCLGSGASCGQDPECCSGVCDVTGTCG